jgi:hypothetical protein
MIAAVATRLRVRTDNDFVSLRETPHRRVRASNLQILSITNCAYQFDKSVSQRKTHLNQGDEYIGIERTVS